MKDFISPKPILEKISQSKIDKFIDTFNKGINNGCFSKNTGLDNINVLNDAEFRQVEQQAFKNGYKLLQYEDNYQTVTYKLKPIKS